MDVMSWDRKYSLETGQAKTRDGRLVVRLREATLDDRPILVGDVTVTKPPFKSEHELKTEHHYWEIGGLGINGDDDLVNL
jgi:hypothetical protein